MLRTNKFRSGIKIIYCNEPCLVLNVEFVKPGKGHGFIRVQMRSFISNKLLEKTFKTGEYVELADILEVELIYLYSDRRFWYFFNQKTLEQIFIGEKIIKDSKFWLFKQVECSVIFWNDEPIQVIPPKFVKLKVIKTDPVLKYSQLNVRLKHAELNTGVIVKVPFFIEVGELIKINTVSGEYVSRVL